MENDEILTLKEAAKLLTISIGTLYQWRHAGIIEKNRRYKKSYVLDIREKWITKQLVV